MLNKRVEALAGKRERAMLEAGTFLSCGAQGPGAPDLVEYGDQLTVPLAPQNKQTEHKQQGPSHRNVSTDVSTKQDIIMFGTFFQLRRFKGIV